MPLPARPPGGCRQPRASPPPPGAVLPERSSGARGKEDAQSRALRWPWAAWRRAGGRAGGSQRGSAVLRLGLARRECLPGRRWGAQAEEEREGGKGRRAWLCSRLSAAVWGGKQVGFPERHPKSLGGFPAEGNVWGGGPLLALLFRGVRSQREQGQGCHWWLPTSIKPFPNSASPKKVPAELGKRKCCDAWNDSPSLHAGRRAEIEPGS